MLAALSDRTRQPIAVGELLVVEHGGPGAYGVPVSGACGQGLRAGGEFVGATSSRFHAKPPLPRERMAADYAAEKLLGTDVPRRNAENGFGIARLRRLLLEAVREIDAGRDPRGVVRDATDNRFDDLG